MSDKLREFLEAEVENREASGGMGSERSGFSLRALYKIIAAC